MIKPFQKQIAIFFFSGGIYFYNPFYLLQFWIVSSPVFENFLFRPIFYSFFGSKRFYDYTEATSAGFSFLELFQYDRIIVLILFYHVLINRNKSKLRRTPIDNCLIALVLLLFISCVSSNNVLHSVRYVFDTFLMFYMSYYIGRRFINTEEKFISVLDAIIVLGSLLCASGLLEYKLRANNPNYSYFGPYRITGPFLSWESLAVTLSIVLFVTIYRITITPSSNRLVRRYLIGLLTVTAVCIIMTGTRTTMAAVLVGFVIIFFLGRHILNRKIIFWGTFIVVLSTIVLIAAPIFITKTSFYTDTIMRDTAGDRIEQYSAAFGMLKRNPIFGIGFLNFKEDFGNYVDVENLQFSTAGRTTLHNSYMVIAVENGVVTFFPLLLLIMYIFLNYRRMCKEALEKKVKFLYIIMISISFAYFSSAMTFDMFFAPPPNIFNKIYYLLLGATISHPSFN